MSETERVLRKLGWSDELIDAFIQQDVIAPFQPLPDFNAAAHFVDVTELTVSLDEPAIGGGTDLKIIS